MGQPESSEIRKAFGEALKAIRDRKNWTQEQMAEYLEVSPGSVANWETFRNSAPLEEVVRIADKLEVSIGFLMGRVEGAPVLNEGMAPYGTKKKPVSGQDSPVVSWASAGAPGFYYEDAANQTDEFLATNCKDPNCFWLRIEGDSMVDEVKPGDTVLLAPNMGLMNGRIVGVKLKEESGGGILCKLYHRIGEMVRLTSYNSAYPMMEYHISAFEWIFPMYEQRRKPTL